MPSLLALLPDDRPTRILATATLVNTFGNGLFFTASVVYLTRVVGLSAGQVGFGLTLAGIAGVVSGVPAGHLGDRLGAREVLASLTLLSAFLVGAFAWVRGFAAYLVVVVLYAFVDRGAGAVRQALVAAVSPEDGRVRTRAYLRAVTNVGLGLGSLFAGGVLLVACAVFAAASWPGPAVEVLVLVAGALVHVVGEMRQSAGSWGVAFGLAPDHLQGQYQGLFTTAFSVSQVLGPLLIVGLPITFGVPGWIALGLILAAASAAVVPVARWGDRTRTAVA